MLRQQDASVLKRIPLPTPPDEAIYLPVSRWTSCWAPDGSVLCICCGLAWSGLEGADPHNAGLAFVDCKAGTTSTAALPSQAALLAKSTAPAVHSWSPDASRLLVSHALDNVACYILYSRSGQPLAHIPAPLSANRTPAHASDNCWAPDSHAIALLTSDGFSGLWIWQLGESEEEGAVRRLETDVTDTPGFESVAWSPCSQRLLLVAGGSRVLLVSKDLQVLAFAHDLGNHGLPDVPLLGVGGVAAVFRGFKYESCSCYERLCLYGDGLEKVRIMKASVAFLGQHESQAAFSPDGAHLLVISCQVVAGSDPAECEPGEPYTLNIIHLATGTVQQQHKLGFEPYRLAWVSQSNIVVEDILGQHAFLLSYA